MTARHHKEGEPKQDARGEKLLTEVKSVALLRLIDEVRFGEDICLDGYNRVYSRHNRSI